MATTKKPNKLVVIAVILIWTIVIGQIVFYGFFNNPDEIALSQPQISAKFIKKEYDIDNSFTLRNDYPDPFKVGKLQIPGAVRTGKAVPVLNDTISIPQLFYKGVISDGGNGNKIFALSIDNTDYAIKAGESISGVQVLKGDEKEISLMVNKKRLQLKIIE